MPELIDQSVRLQVLLERVKSGENARIDAFLRQEDKILRERLTRADLTAVQRDKIEDKLEEIRVALTALHKGNLAALKGRLGDLAETVSDTEAKSLAAALDGFDTNVPTAAVIRTAVEFSPLSVRGAGGGMLLDTFLDKWSEADIDRMVGAVRRGFFEGRTTDQIVRDIRGTQGANFGDGELAVSRRNMRTVVHTSIQHMAHIARAATWQANADIIKGYRWVSTLDSRTSETCQSLDGQEFELGEGPMPPAHPNCRSTVAPVTKSFRELGLDIDEMEPGTRASQDGQVPASLTYFEWLKTQPAGFQEEALGETRAKLFRDGGLSADEFAKLQLGRNFQPLTIEQMREKAPMVFERAGID